MASMLFLSGDVFKGVVIEMYQIRQNKEGQLVVCHLHFLKVYVN